MSGESKTVKYEPPTMEVGTACLICDEFVPLPDWQRVGYRICDRCKKRLIEVLYGDG